MRKCKLSSPTGNPFEVFNLMYPQDRKYKNNISLFSLNGDNMTYLDKVHPADISAAIASHTFYKDLDYYITANTFVGDCGRSQATLFSLTNIVIDLDIHSLDKLFETDNSENTTDSFCCYARFSQFLCKVIKVPFVGFEVYLG